MQKRALHEASRARVLCLEPLRSWACSAVRQAEGQAPWERRKTSRGRTALLALDAELNCKRNCPWSTERESRHKRRHFEMILFLADVRVKENRTTLLCKRGYTAAEAARRKAAILFQQACESRVSLFRKLNSMVILLYSACGNPLSPPGIDASRSSSAASP